MIPAYAIRDILKAATAVTTLVPETRIYVGRWPQDERRARILIERVSDVPTKGQDNVVQYWTARFQVNCISTNLPNAHAIAAAAADALNDFTGTAGEKTVDWCDLDDARDLESVPADGELDGESGISIDVTLQYQP